MLSQYGDCCSKPELADLYGCHLHRGSRYWDEQRGSNVYIYRQCPSQWVPKNIDDFIELLAYHKEYNVPMPQWDLLPERTKIALKYYRNAIAIKRQQLQELEDKKVQ